MSYEHISLTPEDAIERLEKLSLPQQLSLLSALTTALKKQAPQMCCEELEACIFAAQS